MKDGVIRHLGHKIWRQAETGICKCEYGDYNEGYRQVQDRFDPPPRRYAAGIAFLRGQGAGRVSRVHGLERAQRELGSLVAEVSLPRPGQHPAGSYEGEGYVVLRHSETAVVAEALQRLVQIVRVELDGEVGR